MVMLEELIAGYNLNLRVREGKNRWSGTLDKDSLMLAEYNDVLQTVIVFKKSNNQFRLPTKFYLLTKAGAFRTDYPEIWWALEREFGLTYRHVRDANDLTEQIERQLELKEKAEKILPYVSRSERFLDVDPEIGVIAERDEEIHFYPPGKYGGVKLPGWLNTIQKVVFGLYGRDIPEKPDIATDLKAPPWTIRRFGKPMVLYLLDEDPHLDLYVYTNPKGGLFVGYGTRSIGIYWGVKPDVASAFRAAFGVDLPPQATREDVEAIAAMAALGEQ